MRDDRTDARPDGQAGEAEEAARASDIEQRHGRAGNSSDSHEASLDVPVHPPPELVGSSGHVVRRETAEAWTEQERTGSPGAEADRQAAQRKG